MATRKLVRQGCETYLCFVTKDRKKEIEDIPVIREFLDVFLEEIAGLPPKREIDFEIELEPGACPILKRPYRISPVELKINKN